MSEKMEIHTHTIVPPLNLQRTDVKNQYRYEGPFPGVPNPNVPNQPPTITIEKCHVKDGKPNYTITIQNQPHQEIKITSETYSMVSFSLPALTCRFGM